MPKEHTSGPRPSTDASIVEAPAAKRAQRGIAGDNDVRPARTHDTGTRMLLNKASEREWLQTDYPGIERSLFRNNDTGGRSSVVRLLKGSRFPRHAHRGTEEVVVLSGLVTVGGVSLAAGDYLFTSPGEEHDVVALADSELFVSSQKATPVVEQAGPRT